MVSKKSDAKKSVLLCVNTLLEKKAKDLVIINVKEMSSFADYLVICSGTSDRQVRALSAFIQEKLKKSGMFPLGVEGEDYGQWVLMDYADVVIHIFLEPVRELYDLEKLWMEAPCMEVGEDVAKLVSLRRGM
ncbi:MAG: ribosome silencing factor [Deltaproteobacteria bacterium]|nr:ribosome silencing factor [Deltaproteobacteria bacterium]